jgi:hypothetical protein
MTQWIKVDFPAPLVYAFERLSAAGVGFFQSIDIESKGISKLCLLHMHTSLEKLLEIVN